MLDLIDLGSSGARFPPIDKNITDQYEIPTVPELNGLIIEASCMILVYMLVLGFATYNIVAFLIV